jgi:hypothetical protein
MNMIKKAAEECSITVVLNLKRIKDEVDYANKESDRLHALIAADKQVEWAKEQLQRLHEMIFLPSAEQVRNELIDTINKADPGAYSPKGI